MKKVNLSGFCDIQKEVWEKFRKAVEEKLTCDKCNSKLQMTAKFMAQCVECKTRYKIKKPKFFPKNMDDTRNWKATCCECSGTMDYFKNRSCGAYICRKCSNVLEV